MFNHNRYNRINFSLQCKTKCSTQSNRNYKNLSETGDAHTHPAIHFIALTSKNAESKSNKHFNAFLISRQSEHEDI